jgi:hypothetical protein
LGVGITDGGDAGGGGAITASVVVDFGAIALVTDVSGGVSDEEDDDDDNFCLTSAKYIANPTAASANQKNATCFNKRSGLSLATVPPPLPPSKSSSRLSSLSPPSVLLLLLRVRLLVDDFDDFFLLALPLRLLDAAIRSACKPRLACDGQGNQYKWMENSLSRHRSFL